VALPAFALVISVFFLLYLDTASAIVGIWWRSETFAHGFLVVPIVLWLVWRRRPTLAAISPQPGALAGLVLALAGLGWLLGELAAVNALSQLALVAMLALLVPTLLGYQVAAAIAFPLAFLFFGVPFGEFAMPQLMQWTADFTVLALRMSGIPVYREGLQFVIPSGNWSVVEACSGIRYIIASLTVGTLFAYLNYQTTRRRVLFIVVSLLVPVLANWLRAYIIVMLGHLSGNKLAAGVDHLIYGWAFFGAVIMLMFWIGARWSEPEPDQAVATAALSPQRSQVSSTPTRWFLASAAVVAVLVLPHLARWAIHQSQASKPTPTLIAPAEMSAGWAAIPDQPVRWRPAFNNPSAQLDRQYRKGEQVVNLYVGYYQNQNNDRKLVSSENVLVKSNDAQWAQVARGQRMVQTPSGAALNVRTAELRGSPLGGESSAERLTVWQLYWVNGTLTSSDILAKAYTALYSLLGRGDNSAVIIVYAPRGESNQGEQALDAFMQSNTTAISAWLSATQPQ
jgi:exosortase A